MLLGLQVNFCSHVQCARDQASSLPAKSLKEQTWTYPGQSKFESYFSKGQAGIEVYLALLRCVVYLCCIQKHGVVHLHFLTSFNQRSMYTESYNAMKMNSRRWFQQCRMAGDLNRSV